MSAQSKHAYEFGPFLVDTANHLLLRDGRPVPLEPKTFDTLVKLIEHRGEVLEKGALMEMLWPGQFVEESNLAQNVYKLRKALGQEEGGAVYVKTVPKRGYRFVADVRERREAVAGGAAADAADTGEGHAPEDSPAAQVRLPGTPGRRRVRLALSALGLAAVLAVASALLLRSRGQVERAPSAAPPEMSIAVLPFRPMSADGGDEYLQLGMADALITKLSNINRLVVRPTSSVRGYTDPNQDLVAAGRALRVESVLAGGVQKVGERVRVTVQLINVNDGRSVWAEKFDEPLTDIFGVQDAISERVAALLVERISAEERRRLTKRPTDNIEAYQLYLRGNHHLLRFTPPDLQKALQYFDEAIARDPGYALAYAGRANVYGIAASSAEGEAAARAEVAAVKAVELDPTLAEAYASLGTSDFWLKRDARSARERFARALELNPNSASVHHYYSWFLTATARFDEAESHLRRALELDPLSPAINVDQGLPLFFARRYGKARERYERALALDEQSFYAHFRLGEASEASGDYARAVGEFERAVALSKGDPVIRTKLARALALAGKRKEARRILGELTAKGAPRALSPYYAALAYAALDSPDEAFAWLDRALAGGDKWLGWLRVDPRLDSLRADARFHSLLRRAGFEQ